MIIKHVAMKTVQKSSFVELTKYITSAQDKQERVGVITVTNCRQQDPLDAALEVYATQAQNKRATSDKTYHIIISFRAGEQPSDQVLKEIEEKVCADLGYAEHQRISAVHHDTDNLHIHVAINKIHPTRLTIHTPYFDHLKFGSICERLEQQYGLERDNHQVKQTSSESRAADMEHMAGIESLLGWIKRECLPDLRKANSWTEFNQALQQNGLEIKQRGNGFVVTDRNGTAVKASSIARDLSKEKLETKFGPFEPAPKIDAVVEGKGSGKGAVSKKPVGKVGKSPPPVGLRHPDTIGQIGVIQIENGKWYQAKPVQTKYDTTELFSRYQEQQGKFAGEKLRGMQSARAGRIKSIEDAKRAAKLKRAAIKLLGEPAPVKRALYAMTHKKLLADIQKIRGDFQQSKTTLADRTRRQSWNEWLQSQAKGGNQEALAALRARDAKRERLRDSISSAQAPVTPSIKLDSVTKKGTVIYRDGSTSIRDNGDRLKVAKGSGADALEAALRLAILKYGSRIKVNGSDEFRERIAQVAVNAKINVSFDDASLEKRRQFLLATQQKQEKTDVNRHSQPIGQPGSGRPGIGSGVIGQRAAIGEPGGRFSSHTRPPGQPGNAGTGSNLGISPGRAADRPIKPGVGKVGFFPPPPNRKRLRNLSQLGVVRIANGSEVLLPRDVHTHMGNEGTEPHHGMRRSVFGAGGIVDPKVAAVSKYVAEREAKRLQGFDITKHSSYNGEGIREATYAGLRVIDGQQLALVRTPEHIAVVPVDEKTAQRLGRLKLGESLSVSGNGSIKKRGRSR